MAIITGFTLIRILSIFHITLAYYFLTSPRTLADQSLVFIMGEAMQLPHARALEMPSAGTSALAMILTLLGVSDLVAVSLPEEISRYFWASQVPIRLFFFFMLPAYIYMFRPGGLTSDRPAEFPAGAGDGIKTDIVFTWAFVELISWFWIYTTLREERKEAAIRIMERRKKEDDTI